MEKYREARISELKAQAARGRFGDVREICRGEYQAEVTDGSGDCWVVLHLYNDS
jgi:hypothetical protein